MKDNREIEIKFGVLGRPESLPRILASAGRVGQERSDNLSNTYYDTEDHRLFALQCGLRVRRAGRYTEQTLKIRGNNVAGIHSRGEYNVPLPADAAGPNLALFPGEVFRDADPGELQARLRPVCQIDFTRESFDFEIMDSAFEVAYDHGGIKLPGGSSFPINELEVELKRTDRSGDELVMLFSSLASIFAERGLPLVLEPFSKMHRATLLLENRRNSLNFSNMTEAQSLSEYVVELIKSFENLYGLFLVKHDPLVFTYVNSTLYTLIRALKQLKKSGRAAFAAGEREPVNYLDDLKVIIKILKSLYKKSARIEAELTQLSLEGREDAVLEQVYAMREVECRYKAFLIPLKLKLLMSMLAA